MKHPKLETGMFGEMNNGDIFVIVNDLIVYEDGDFDEVSMFDKDCLISMYTDTCITKLTNKAKSFNYYKCLKDDDFLFDRSKEAKRMTIAEIEEALGYKIEIVQPCYPFTDANDKPVDNY